MSYFLLIVLLFETAREIFKAHLHDLLYYHVSFLKSYSLVKPVAMQRIVDLYFPVT